jgi:ribosomal protein S18 acetylase RimI-like enzyme
LSIQQCFRLKPVQLHQHFLFNLLNLLYFRKNAKNFSLESSPLFAFILVPGIAWSEVYFFKKRRCFVTLGQQIVGNFAFEERDDVLYISNLAVSPFYRRIGVATYMLDQAARLANQLGKRTLKLSVNKSNAPALKLYMKQGFSKEDERINSYILRRRVSRLD